jgi:PAS domain S-box-containing protein
MPPPVEENLFRALVDQAPDALVFADCQGRIRIWNRAAEQIFGYPAAEVIGESLDLMIPERFRTAHWAGYQRALSSGQTKYAGRVMTTRSVHRDGRKIYMDLSFSLVRASDGAIVGVLAIGRDSTERHAGVSAAS